MIKLPESRRIELGVMESVRRLRQHFSSDCVGEADGEEQRDGRDVRLSGWESLRV